MRIEPQILAHVNTSEECIRTGQHTPQLSKRTIQVNTAIPPKEIGSVTIAPAIAVWPLTILQMSPHC